MQAYQDDDGNIAQITSTSASDGGVVLVSINGQPALEMAYGDFIARFRWGVWIT